MIMRRSARGADVEDAHVVDLKGFDDYDAKLGDMMRGERATLGKSLLDVQRELRIKAAYIAAIENCDPSAFDTPGFVAGYVRSYARYLNLDPDRTFREFCSESGFSVAHGMSSDASAARKDTREQRLSRPQGLENDPFKSPSTPFVPAGEAMLHSIEPRAIGSVLVLLALIGGIGYGGWTVLKQVQQVQVAPVEQVPVVLSDLDPLAGSLAGTGDEVSAEAAETHEALDRLYRPQALDVPVLVARDAPIATLDPRNLGSFRGNSLSQIDSTAPDRAVTLDLGIRQALADVQGVAPGGPDGPAVAPPQGPAVPQVVEDLAPTLRMVTVRPSWVRVRAADGSVIFEGIMQPGESFDIPATEEPPTLRAGESGAVYFALGDAHYGPVGAPGAVTKNIAMSPEAVQERFALADLARDADLQRVVEASRVAEVAPAD
ncbi:MAG: DUF4115 domain-containing protein [Marinibacterium sp.]|nr:DUF4115 domain-containing protein [Marinibacterium sp.]